MTTSENLPSESSQPEGISRRNFLILAGVAITAGAGALIPEQQQPPQQADHEAAPRGVTSPQEEEWTYGDTVKLSLKALGVEITEVVVARACGLEIGNAATGKIRKKVKERPVRTAGMMIGVIPILEEGVFRQFPSWTADYLQPRKSSDRRWALGALTSAAFAMAHGWRAPGERKLVFPIPQFTDGLFSWFLQRRAGYKHAVLSHGVHNSIVYLLAAAGPEEKLPNPMSNG